METNNDVRQITHPTNRFVIGERKKNIHGEEVSVTSAVEKRRARERERYRINAEKERQKSQTKRDKLGREKYNEKQRKRYAANKEHNKAVIYEGRIRRNPTRGLKSQIDKINKGDIDLNEAIESFSERLAQLLKISCEAEND